MLSSDCSICQYFPWSYLKLFWKRRGINRKCTCLYRRYISQAALKSVCVSLMFLSLIGSFIYALQLNHQNTFSGSLGRTSKSSSVFGLQMCLWAPCNFLHMLFLSSKWLLRENWGNKDRGEGLPRTGFFAENKMPCCTTQGNVSNIAGLPPKFPNCNDKNGQKNHWNHLKNFFWHRNYS